MLKAGREFRLDAQRIGLAEGERLDVDEIEGFGELYPGFERLRAAFAAMGEAMRANEGRDNELDTLAERHAELMEQMEAWTAIFVKCRNGAADAGAASGADAEVRWLEVSQHGIRFNLTPLSFAEEFREMREREGGAWVFTSATLSSAGRFDLFKQRLGIGECVERTWESPFNYWEQGCFYLPQMPPPANNTAVHTHNRGGRASGEARGQRESLSALRSGRRSQNAPHRRVQGARQRRACGLDEFLGGGRRQG